jgi:hypothetical protein
VTRRASPDEVVRLALARGLFNGTVLYDRVELSASGALADAQASGLRARSTSASNNAAFEKKESLMVWWWRSGWLKKLLLGCRRESARWTARCAARLRRGSRGAPLSALG